MSYVMVGDQKLQRDVRTRKTPVTTRNVLKRRLPVGAEIVGNGVHFRVWAPRSRRVSVHLDSPSNGGTKIVPLGAEADGYFSGLIADAKAGMLYKYELDSGIFPDPASRYQPDGPQGPSQIVDPSAFRWTDKAWRVTVLLMRMIRWPAARYAPGRLR